MSSTLTVRIPRELKERMRRLQADWSEEIRSFLKGRVGYLELIRTLKEIESRAEKRRLTVDSTRLIREDRAR